MTDAGTRTAPNLETLAAAKPDLILINDSLGDLYPKLSKIAPTVVTAGNGINWKRDLLLVGDAVGKGDKAQELLDGIVSDAATRGKQLGDPAVSMVRFAPDRTRMFGVSSFTGSIAVDMGLSRPKSQQFTAISQDIGAESIDVADGDWIFYSVQGDASRTDAGSVLAGPLWKSMKAVKAGHAVKVDDDPSYSTPAPPPPGSSCDSSRTPSASDRSHVRRAPHVPADRARGVRPGWVWPSSSPSPPPPSASPSAPRPVPLSAVLDALVHGGSSPDALVVRSLRVPRTAIGLTAGAALGLSGAALPGGHPQSARRPRHPRAQSGRGGRCRIRHRARLGERLRRVRLVRLHRRGPRRLRRVRHRLARTRRRLPR